MSPKPVNHAAQLAAAMEQVAQVVKERQVVQDRFAALGKKNSDLEKSVEALKSDLAIALTTISRQQGYIDRVLEDDGIKEGRLEFSQIAETRTEPKRRGPGFDQIYVPQGMAMGHSDNKGWGRVEDQPKPWFSR